MSIIRLFLSILFRPARALSYVRDHPKWLWLTPAILAIIMLVTQSLITAPISAKMAAEQMEKQLANIPPEQRAQMPGFVSTGPSITFLALTTIIGGLIGTSISWLFQAGVLHVACLALGGQNRFTQMFSMVAWAWLPNFFRGLIQIPYIALTGKLITQPGLSSLVATGDPLRDSANLMYAFLARIDIFWLWGLVLLIIGVAVVARFSKAKAILVSLGYWALSTGLGLVPVLLGRFFMTRFAPPMAP